MHGSSRYPLFDFLLQAEHPMVSAHIVPEEKFPSAQREVARCHIRHTCSLLLFLLLVPPDAIFKLHPRASEDVQRAANRKIDLAIAQLLHQLEVLERSAATRVRHGDTAPLGELAHELVVDSTLEAFHVGCVDEELCAVRLEARYGLWHGVSA